MLTYRISPHKAPHKVASGAAFMQKGNILMRQVTRCPFKVGDEVRVQTNKGKYWGVVDELIIDPRKCEWHNGTQPYFISVRCPVITSAGVLLTNQSMIVTAPLKKVKK